MSSLPTFCGKFAIESNPSTLYNCQRPSTLEAMAALMPDSVEPYKPEYARIDDSKWSCTASQSGYTCKSVRVDDDKEVMGATLAMSVPMTTTESALFLALGNPKPDVDACRRESALSVIVPSSQGDKCYDATGNAQALMKLMDTSCMGDNCMRVFRTE